MTNAQDAYALRFQKYLQDVAERLEAHVRELTRDLDNIDQITARAKDPASFSTKAASVTQDGKPRYRDPLTEIQDQLGVRIVVFYKQTVDVVVSTIDKYFRRIEEKDLVPESEWEFGYFGKHLVLATPADVVPREVTLEETPRFFELQVKTLFQHAWSQANHDLGYKSPRELQRDQKRLLAFAAAQAWGADRTFAELQQALG